MEFHVYSCLINALIALFLLCANFRLCFSTQSSLLKSMSLLVDWTNDCVRKNPREMGKAEKLSPSPTYPKSESKRTKVILEAVRRTDGNAIRQHARESAAMKMDETIETDRETIETDEKWQTLSNQRSNKIQKTNTHAPTTATSFFGQKIPQDPKTSGVHSYFSFGDNETRTKPTSPQHGLEKCSPGGSSAHADGRRRSANLPPFKLEFDAQRKPIEIQVFNDWF